MTPITTATFPACSNRARSIRANDLLSRELRQTTIWTTCPASLRGIHDVTAGQSGYRPRERHHDLGLYHAAGE
jgi:hypothetical protein